MKKIHYVYVLVFLLLVISVVQYSQKQHTFNPDSITGKVTEDGELIIKEQNSEDKEPYNMIEYIWQMITGD